MKTTRTRGAPWALVLALTLALAALGLVPTASAADYSIIINSMTNGAVTADKTSANQGETVTLTIAPAEGYELNTLTISKGTSPYISKSGAALSYEFNIVIQLDCTL